MKIWLADLTYTQQSIASDVVPAGIGLLAEYLEFRVPEINDVRLFKYPEDLAIAFEDGAPDIIGFSNYVWNSLLSLRFAKEIKAGFPDTVIVFGGPNFPMAAHEQFAVLSANPWIDYYVMKEAEAAFANLVTALMSPKTNRSKIGETVSNLVYLDSTGQLYASRETQRLPNLGDIPSPYLSGRLDKFLDGRLLPVIQTARGCPFSCAFCTEGQLYWNKVRHKTPELVANEVTYIAARMAGLSENQRRTDLLIADSNFAMFSQDIDTCKAIAKAQRDYNYPRYINVATGKNKKERVLEAATLVGGAMKLSGSVQSLDPTVQENMHRTNISAEQIMEMAIQSAEIGANTYSEVILALPGDTRRAHFETLKTLVDAGFNMISMYQLMLLTGTEFGSDEAVQKYGMDIRYRVVPRCFGSYDFLGRQLNVAEIEEICVANNTLSYSEYLECRKMNFLVNVFFNDGVFGEIISLLKKLKISPWNWIERIYTATAEADFQELIDRFLEETETELWRERQPLEAFVTSGDVIEQYLSGELGSNLIFKFKSLSMTRYFRAVCDVASRTISDLLMAELPDADRAIRLAREIVEYKRLQVENLFDDDGLPRWGIFHYDITKISLTNETGEFELPEFDGPQQIEFRLSDEQRQSIENYTDLFGNDIIGLTRILSRVFLKQLFRQPGAPRNVTQ
ncbi:MAG TPA: hypothetical protein ENI69_02185 [Rhodospirillales bacterium]|nr:hypothetical protein [Rhodospirillales bacterium]